jgi:FKBP-type peptidyl-prolyl cis-trans isomerase 2
MSQVQNGNRVKVHYTGKFEDGTVFGSSEGSEPLEFTIGEGNVLPGLESAVMGMNIGDKKTVTLPPGEAYGEYSHDLVAQIARKDLPSDLDPNVGDRLKMQRADGQEVIVAVTKTDEQAITIDANPPLAGKTLVIELELIEIAA